MLTKFGSVAKIKTCARVAFQARLEPTYVRVDGITIASQIVQARLVRHAHAAGLKDEHITCRIVNTCE